LRRAITFVALLIVLALLAFACTGGSGAPPAATTTTVAACSWEPTLPVVRVTFPGGTIDAEVAQSPQDRAQGLGGRACLPADAGMILDAGTIYVPRVWMRGMLIPLDLVWIDEAGTVAAVEANVQPEPGVADGDLQRYSPPRPVRYTLEINAGAAERLGLTPGVPITVGTPE
jgi:uncharacterized membrane protein (UPF0127 family)